MTLQDKPHPEAPRVSEAPLTLLQRLHAVMVDVTYVQKDRTIDVGKRGYKVVTHDAVTAKVRPALVKHGVFYYPQKLGWAQNNQRTEVDMVIRFVSVDDKDDFIDVPTLGFGLDTGDKGPGKAMSYAVKYALLKALGLETGEDADNEASPETAPPEIQGQIVPSGPRGGKPKPERNAGQIALQWFVPGKGPDAGAKAATYPFDGWDNIRAFLSDLSGAVEVDPQCWDTNQNDIRRVRDKLTQAGHTALLDQLTELDLRMEQRYLQAG